MIMNRSHLCCSRSVRPTRTSTTPTWTTARTAPSTTRRPLSTRWNDVTNLLTTRTKSFCDPPAFTHRQNVLCYVGCHEYPLSGIEHSKHVINTWQLKCQINTNKYVKKSEQISGCKYYVVWMYKLRKTSYFNVFYHIWGIDNVFREAKFDPWCNLNKIYIWIILGSNIDELKNIALKYLNTIFK